MRYSPNQLNRKRGRKKKAGHTKTDNVVSAALAIFCSRDDFLMKPALTPEDPTGRVTKRTIIYVCPQCSNVVNPLSEPTINAMTVQTRDNAIQYKGRRRTIASTKSRSYDNKKEDALDKFINDPEPYLQRSGVTVVKRTIERKGTKRFKLAI